MSVFEQIITVSLNPAIDRIIEVPNFTIGAHQRGRQLSRHPAGKATGFVGRNEVEQFERFLSSGRTNSQFLAVDGATRENVTIVDPTARQETHIRDVGFVVSQRELTRLKKKLHLICRPTSLVIFSGSMPPGIGAEQFVELVQLCLHAQAKVAVDTSGPALQAVARLSLWLVKPNVAELAEIVGQPIHSDDQIVATGCQL
ncbi:MAG: 1-phosphofructokinase family hexose kinase, partial [Phycisphaerae bacterium]